MFSHTILVLLLVHLDVLIAREAVRALGSHAATARQRAAAEVDLLGLQHRCHRRGRYHHDET